ncbi:MAG: restriction endonuclease [Eubacterium sp.]|nr:restriction endonuclease [Eubacterium sp.]
MEKLILIVFFITIILGIKEIITMIIGLIRKTNFSVQYGINKLPREVKVRKKKSMQNYYVLNYPYWSVSKKDGTADLRVKTNTIIWQKSNLYIDDYMVTSKKPYKIIQLVKELRLQGAAIDLCKEEQQKRLELIEKKAIFTHNSNIQNIIDYYSEKPTNFELLCADLFERIGYNSKVTPSTNDGGYDILLSKGEEKIIVECKCYSMKHRVGRPAIQKLVGANNIVLADRMIFITTSEFSASAVLYAEELGIELINGYKLLEMLEEQGFLENKEEEVSVSECQLKICDIASYIPKDIYEEYFL